jgi:hypothetical protein
MSNLSEFIGVGIKSVQTGITATGSFPTDVTINAVDITKSFICINGAISSSTLVTQYGIASLIDSITVRLSRISSNAGATYTMYWSVVEYY